MQIQVFSEYLQMAQAGEVVFLACPMHTQELAEFPLLHKEENNKIVLYCTACSYKNIPGLIMYNNLIKLIEAAKNERRKMEVSNMEISNGEN